MNKRLSDFYISKTSPKKLILSFLLFAIFIFSPLFAADADVTTITINNARNTTYKSNKDSENDSIILEGSVDIQVSKGSTSSNIKADKITYDRKSEMLYAEGNVSITTKTDSSGEETATASSIMMNTSTLEGVFADGRVIQTKSDAINLPSGSTLVVFSDVFGKSETNVIAFKNSSLTFCDDDDPHWKINASRTWLLPGGEFAFLNALLYVGKVPVMYFPAFYYPKDELIFNPVFGYATRTGYSVQTTTYLYGRKPLDTSSSSSDSDSTAAEESLKGLYNFMRPGSLKNQEREGLVLHNLDSDYTGNTTNYVKLMADWYSTLGMMAGLDGKLSPLPKYISNLTFNAYFGFSNTIFESGGDYVAYSPTGKFYYDKSNFMGSEIPFRYSGNLQFTLTKPFKLSLSLPIYSDPYFANDFLNYRQETMDWISYLMQNKDETDDTATIYETSSFTWTLSSSYSPTIPDIFKPYVSSASISLNSSVAFSTKSAVFHDSTTGTYYYDTSEYENDWTEFTPMRKFYYPSQIIPVKIDSSISGTIFQYPESSTKKSTSPNYKLEPNLPEELKTEAQKQKEADDKRAAEESKEQNLESKEIAEVSAEKKNETLEPVLPDLSHTSSLKTFNEDLTYKLTYSVTPSLNTSIAYASTNLNQSSDFDWTDIKSYMYTAKIPTALNSALTYGGSFVSVSNKVAFNPVFQSHPYIKEGESSDGAYTSTEADNLRLADYKAESRDLTNTNSISFKPFLYTEHFSDSYLSWDSTIKLYRREFIGDAENPDWENYTLDWTDDDCVTVNSLNLNLTSSEYNNKFKQALVFTAIMPPLLKKYSATLNLTFPYVTGSLSSSFSETTHDDVSYDEKWTKNPLQQSLSVSLFNSTLKLTESYNYSFENETSDSLKLSAAWKGLSLSYVMSYTTGYDFDSTNGWTPRSSKEFLPYSLSFDYSGSTSTLYTWKNRINLSAGLTTKVQADLIRPTNSYFTFTPKLTFNINEFFSLTFSSTSKNSILYWYFHNEDGDPYSEWGGFPGNMVSDLLNSFRFDNESLRLASGFKLKSMNMTMTHALHDWKFNMTMAVSPKLVTKSDKKYYDFTPSITIGIVWNPMESIKSNLVYEYDDDEQEGIWSLEQ